MTDWLAALERERPPATSTCWAWAGSFAAIAAASALMSMVARFQRAGEVKKIKRRTHKRERRDGKAEARSAE